MKYPLAATLLATASLTGQDLRTTLIASGVAGPTDIAHAGDGSGRLFFVQQNGLVRIFRNGALAPQPFLDITSKTRAGGERGLLGIAFAPSYANSGRFYVNYTDLEGDTVIAQYRVSSDPDRADAASELVLLRIDQPYSNHNGGQIRFGPDGFLYIGMGDGGSAGDPQRNAQNPGSLLGKMLRLDVESQPGAVRIPADNPFANSSGTRSEIWASGLRNPWRFSFDRDTGDLWIADVGQSALEEINFQPAASRGGENYGWNVAEGTRCYGASTCNTAGFTAPVWEYSHNEGCSVTGGFVYRGAAIPSLRGIYLFSDYCSGRIWGLSRNGAWSNRTLLATTFGITTFGQDQDGELYIADANAGRIYRLDGSRAPGLSASGVVNAASFAPGLTAGSLATVFATGLLDSPGMVTAPSFPLPRVLSGVRVLVDGIEAPLHLVANANGQEQINFQVPYELRGRSSVSVSVSREGQTSAAVAVPLLEIQPGVYSSGERRAVAVRAADYALITAERPASAGEYLFVYAAGLGRSTDEPPTGAAAPLTVLARAQEQIRVTLGGVACDVQFAGLAPGYAGVYQVNFRVPAGLPAGEQPLVIEAGPASSPAVTIPVR